MYAHLFLKLNVNESLVSLRTSCLHVLNHVLVCHRKIGLKMEEDLTRDLILGKRCTQHYICDALSGHSLSLLLRGVPVNPRC